MNENTNVETHPEITVGEILRNARTTGRRKREIQTVSKQLCIREEFLQALEDGKYDVIPETVYILGFARNYAMELGLDPDEIVSKLKREMGLVTDTKEDDCVEDCVNVVNVEEEPRENKYKSVLRQCIKYIRRHWLWFTIGLVILVIIIALTIVLSSTSDSVNRTAEESVVVHTTSAVEPEYNVTVRERFGTENADTAAVILQATQESWVKIEDARGNTVFSRVLVPGDIYYVPDGNEYSAIFGNAGGIDVWVNGALAPKQGADHVRVSDISMNPNRLLPNVTGAE